MIDCCRVSLTHSLTHCLCRYKIIEQEVVVEQEVEKEVIETIVIGQRQEDIAEQNRLREGVRACRAVLAACLLVALLLMMMLFR